MAHSDVEDALDQRAPEALVEATAEDQPAGIDIVDADLAQRLLEVGGDVVDLDAAELAVQQLAQRHAAGAALGQRDDDFVDLQAARGFGQRLSAGGQQFVGRDGHVLLVRAGDR
jgi:hypothetical protein